MTVKSVSLWLAYQATTLKYLYLITWEWGTDSPVVPLKIYLTGLHVLRLNSAFTAQLPVKKRCFFSSWAKVWSGLSLRMIQFTFPELTEAALFVFSAISSAACSLPEQRKDEILSCSETLTYILFDHSFCQGCSPSLACHLLHYHRNLCSRMWES